MNAKGSSSGGENSAKEKPVDKPRRARDEKRDRKKDDKSVEHVLKALNSLDTPEEKLAAMCKKYADILNDHRMLQNAAKQAEKRCCVLQRENEQLQADHSKAILTRSRLENLCRELQRQNKAVKEESMMRIREEEEKRKEVSAKFQTTLSEITAMMQQNNDKNTKLRDDNIDMTAKLKSVCEQYEKREQHVEKLAKQMQLEMQLADAKLAKAKMEMAVDKETWLREKQQLLLEKAEYKTRLDEMRGTEQALRDQITLYNNKYDEFHRALTQSNEAIGAFKTEMERMSKQIRKLEKETGSWRARYEHTHGSLLKMTEEKLVSDHELATTNRKLAALQNLCRTLQAQCVQLRTELRQVKGGETDGSSVNCPAVTSTQMDEMKDVLSSEDVCPLAKKNDKDEAVKTCEENGREVVGKSEVTTGTEVVNSISSKVVDKLTDLSTKEELVQNAPKALDAEPPVEPLGKEDATDNTPKSFSNEEPATDSLPPLVEEKQSNSTSEPSGDVEPFIDAPKPVGEMEPDDKVLAPLGGEKPVDKMAISSVVEEPSSNSNPIIPDAFKIACEDGNLAANLNETIGKSSAVEPISPSGIDNDKQVPQDENKIENSEICSSSVSEGAEIDCVGGDKVNGEENSCQTEVKSDTSSVLPTEGEPAVEIPTLPEKKLNGCQTDNPEETRKETNSPPQQVQTNNSSPTGKEKTNSCNKQSGKKKNKKCQ